MNQLRSLNPAQLFIQGFMLAQLPPAFAEPTEAVALAASGVDLGGDGALSASLETSKPETYFGASVRLWMNINNNTVLRLFKCQRFMSEQDRPGAGCGAKPTGSRPQRPIILGPHISLGSTNLTNERYGCRQQRLLHWRSWPCQ